MATYVLRVDTLTRRRVAVLARGMPPIEVGCYRWLELFGRHLELDMRPRVLPINRAIAEQLAADARELHYHQSGADPHELAALLAIALCSKPSHRAPFAAALLERAGYGAPRWQELATDRLEGVAVQQVVSGQGSGKTATLLVGYLDAFMECKRST